MLFFCFMFSCLNKTLPVAACCPVRVPSHLGQQAFIPLLLLHGWYEANTHSRYLHLPAHLEHSTLHTAASRLFSQTEPCAGHSTWNWQHLTGSSQLHHVCTVYSASPCTPLHGTLLLLQVSNRGAALAWRRSQIAAGTGHPHTGRRRWHQTSPDRQMILESVDVNLDKGWWRGAVEVSSASHWASLQQVRCTLTGCTPTFGEAF